MHATGIVTAAVLANAAWAGELPHVTLTPVLWWGQTIRATTVSGEPVRDFLEVKQYANLPFTINARREAFVPQIVTRAKPAGAGPLILGASGARFVEFNEQVIVGTGQIGAERARISILDDNGRHICFVATRAMGDASSPSVTGLWVGDRDGYRRVVRDGEHVSGLAAGEVVRLLPDMNERSVVVDGSGRTLVNCTTSAGGAPVWIDVTDAGASLRFRTDSALAGLHADERLMQFSDTAQRVIDTNAKGDMLAYWRLTPSRGGMVLLRGDVATVLLRDGDALPGANDRYRVYQQLGAMKTSPRINENGDLAFFVWAKEPAPFNGEQRALVTGTADALRTAAREGEPATDTLRHSVLGDVVLGDTGDVAFSSSVSGPGTWNAADSSVFLMRKGAASPSLLVRDHGPAPSWGDGVLAYLPSAASGTTMQFDHRGRLFVSGAMSSANSVLWMTNERDLLEPVLWSGGTVLMGDTPRTIASIATFAAPETVSPGVCAWIRFADGGEGAFIVNVDEANIHSVADLNSDGLVDAYDLNLFFDAFVEGSQGWHGLVADIDGDGFLTFMDFDTFVTAFEQDGTN